MKFSVVVPVYNVEEYIEKCLSSILNQTYSNFEVIIVDDGSTDGSFKIIDKFVNKDKRFMVFKKQNGGLSDARNYGIKYVTGDYLLFVDSDDYIGEDLLLKLNNVLSKAQTDLVTFNSVVCDDSGKVINKRDIPEYVNKDINLIIKELITRPFVEPAWLYCYKVKFWRKYNFKYKKGMYHEDFGLTPLILLNARSISSINYYGYFYVQRAGSITKSSEYDKILKKCNDFYIQYFDLIKNFKKIKDCLKKDILLSYMSECLIFKLRGLNDEDYKKYFSLIKKNHVISRIKPYNLKKFIKKIVALISPKLYIKLFF